MISRNSLEADSRQLTRRIGLIFFFVTLLLGLIEVYACRYELNPDGMDYLDIARQIAAGHWSAAANGYWGTLDSVLLAPLFLFHPPPTWELPLAHLHGIFILLAAFFSFRFFLHTSLDAKATSPDVSVCSLPDWSLSLLGYGLFLWSSLMLVPVRMIGADLLVTVFVYLAAGLLLGLGPKSSLYRFLLFGLVLGAGYWAKAIMFPVGLLFLAVSILKARQWQRNLISALAFLLVAAPLLAALSLPRNRFTFGDSGMMNYSMFVSPGGRGFNWQGSPPESGVPKHPTRRIDGDLTIYEFNGPIAGTYPPSYDPSYWNEGRKATFSVEAQLRRVVLHVPSVIQMLVVAQPSLTAGFLFLLLWNHGKFLRNLLRHWELVAISVATVGLYMLVFFQFRYVGAFVVMSWFAMFLALRVPRDKTWLAGSCIAALTAAMLLTFTSSIAKLIVNGSAESAHGDVEVALQLDLPPDTPVATVGWGSRAYWAHFGQVRIVAEVMGPDETAFWSLPTSKRQTLYSSFRAAGAQWLIAQPPAVLVNALDPGWRQIGTTAYYCYPLKSR